MRLVALREFSTPMAGISNGLSVKGKVAVLEAVAFVAFVLIGLFAFASPAM